MLKKIKNVIKKIKEKKGFTLIELLAVIVILSILILLAMPSVLRIMENARKNAFETEVRSYFKAAQTAFAEMAISNPGNTTLHFQNDSNGDCTEYSPCKLDVDGGNMKWYDITVKVADGNEAKYKYELDSGSYYVTTGNNYVSINEKPNVTATPSQ